MADDPWAQFSPIGAPAQQSAPQTSSDPWVVFAPINPHQEAAPQKTLIDKFGETWPARLVKGIGHAAYSAATLPGDVYQGNTQVDMNDPNFVGRTLDFATMATPMSPRVATSLAPIAGPPTADMLGEAATQGYNTVKNSGAEYNPQAVSGLAQTIAQNLERENFRAGRAPETHKALSEMANPPPGAVSTINDLQYAKQVFGDFAKEPQKYSPTERSAANQAKRHIEDYIANPPASDVLAGDAALAGRALRDADKNYAAKMRSEQITGAQQVAEGNAAAANSGRNIDNAYRQRFNAILKSDKQSLGFSPEEIARMETLRDGTATANALRYTGNMLSGVGGQTAGVLGSVLYNPFMAALPLAGHALKKGADFSTLRQIKALDEATRMRSALGEETAVGAGALTPAEQSRQTLLIRALMAQGGAQQ